MVAEITPLRGTPEKSEPSERQYIGRPERLKTIKRHLGFYPHDNDEASRAMNLLGREGTQYPTLAHLNEVYMHQRAYAADGKEALQSIVRRFESYAGNAVNELLYMDAVNETLAATKPQAMAGFTTTFPLADWQHDGTLKAAFSAVARHIETETFAETEENDRLGKRDLIDYTTGEVRTARILESLGKLRITHLSRLIEAVKTSESQRYDFWVSQLEASRRHLFVREAASVALEGLRRIENQ